MLAKHLDQKTFAERWVIDKDDLIGLKKVFEHAANLHREDGFYPFYLGFSLGLDSLFQDDSIESWPRVFLEFEQALGIVDKPPHYFETLQGAYDE